jgi:hypothetical protein
MYDKRDILPVFFFIKVATSYLHFSSHDFNKDVIAVFLTWNGQSMTAEASTISTSDYFKESRRLFCANRRKVHASM